MSISRSAFTDALLLPPRHVSRTQALSEHLRFYKATNKCKLCGSYFRLTWNMKCVACFGKGLLPPGKSKPRRRAALRGDKLYTSAPCRHCGGTLRYVSNWGCVSCVQERAKAHHAANRIGLAFQLYGEHARLDEKWRAR